MTEQAHTPKKTDTPPVPVPRLHFPLVATCFLLSGFAALLYQTVWLRQFAILLGTSDQALAVILASYMGGLALGSAIAARFVNRIRRPLLTYGLLEGGIALAALAVPLGLALVRSLQAVLFGGSPEPVDAGSLPHTAALGRNSDTLLPARDISRRDQEAYFNTRDRSADHRYPAGRAAELAGEPHCKPIP